MGTLGSTARVLLAAVLLAALAGCAGGGPVEPTSTGAAPPTVAGDRLTPADEDDPDAGSEVEPADDDAPVVTVEPVEPVAPEQPGEAAAAHCEDAQLTMEYRSRPDGSGAGSFGFELVFTNISDAACSFDGWPGLVAQAAGVRLGGPALAIGTTSTYVALEAHGGTAVAEGTGGMPGAYGCPVAESDHLVAFVTSDGVGGGVFAAAEVPVCADDTSTLRLGPLTAG